MTSHAIDLLTGVPVFPVVESRTETRVRGSLGFVVGLDLGKMSDFTAVAIDELLECETVLIERTAFEASGHERVSRRMVRHRIRNLYRYPIGTAYPAIARNIAGVMRQLPAQKRDPELVVDRTGVGLPVVDILREAGLRPLAVGITGGSSITHISTDDVNVPKGILASVVDAALASDRLDITTEAEHSETLKAELAGFHAKVRPTGSVELGAWRDGVHDDLVLAVALACWRGENLPQPARYVRFNLFDRGGGTW